MNISQESLDKLRNIFKEEYGKELNDQELHDSAYNLVGFFDILMKCAHKDVMSYLRLEKEPNGYKPEDGETRKCVLCGYYTPAVDCWIDKNGLKCKHCQKAVVEGIIPGPVCRNKEKWFSFEHLKEKFGIHPATARSLVKKGELKSRIILNDISKPHFTIFLREDNYEFLKIEKDTPPSDMEDYDKQVAEWAERYKQKTVEQKQ